MNLPNFLCSKLIVVIHLICEIVDLRGMMAAISFNENDSKKFTPAESTLVLFLSKFDEPKISDPLTLEKTIDELSIEAETNVKLLTELYHKKLDNVLFLIVKLEENRWRPHCSEFKTNHVVHLRTLPTLIWIGEPYALEGNDLTDITLIQEFIDLKIKDYEIIDKFIQLEEEICKDEKFKAEFKDEPDFAVEFWDQFAAKAVSKEAYNCMRRDLECNKDDVLLEMFSELNEEDKEKFIQELQKSYPEVIPFGCTLERTSCQELVRTTVQNDELEMNTGKVTKQIISVERYLTPQQIKDAEEKLKKPSTKKKVKKKKGKKGGKKGKKGGKKGGKKAAKKGGKKK